MKTGTSHENLINLIKEKIPSGTTKVKFLSDTLCIGKEAVYRRLRGEVPFTLWEAEIITKKLKFSIDSIINTDNSYNKPCYLQLVEYLNPSETDTNSIIDFITLIKKLGEDPNSEIGSACNLLPQSFYMTSSVLAKFYVFKWAYQYGSKELKPFYELEIPPEIKNMRKDLVLAHKSIKTNYYILDPLIFEYLINDIQYFHKIHLMNKEDVGLLKKGLLNLLDYIEDLSIKGKFENGNNFHLYISNINFESNYFYIQTSTEKLAMMKMLTLNTLISSDSHSFEKCKQWVNSLKRASFLISESGEAQRVKFLKKQRECINTL